MLQQLYEINPKIITRNSNPKFQKHLRQGSPHHHLKFPPSEMLAQKLAAEF